MKLECESPQTYEIDHLNPSKSAKAKRRVPSVWIPELGVISPQVTGISLIFIHISLPNPDIPKSSKISVEDTKVHGPRDSPDHWSPCANRGQKSSWPRAAVDAVARSSYPGLNSQGWPRQGLIHPMAFCGPAAVSALSLTCRDPLRSQFKIQNEDPRRNVNGYNISSSVSHDLSVSWEHPTYQV